jgi:hypothetical protein
MLYYSFVILLGQSNFTEDTICITLCGITYISMNIYVMYRSLIDVSLSKSLM